MWKVSVKKISLTLELFHCPCIAIQLLIKGSQASMTNAQSITMKTTYIGKSRKSLLIPLLDLIKGTRFFYSLFLPAFLWRQAKVVTISAAMVQILSSLPLWFSAKERMKRDPFDKEPHRYQTQYKLTSWKEDDSYIALLIPGPFLPIARSHKQNYNERMDFIDDLSGSIPLWKSFITNGNY